MDYEPTERGMICGSAEAENRRYRIHVGKSGNRWLVSTDENCGDYVYVEGGKNSDGFGGRELVFTLESGEVLKLKGPWHSNCEALFQDTGVEARDKHLTFGVVSKGVKFPDHNTYVGVLTDVLYRDEKPVVGDFDRIEKMAEKMSDELGIQLSYFSQSAGGAWRGYTKKREVVDA